MSTNTKLLFAHHEQPVIELLTSALHLAGYETFSSLDAIDTLNKSIAIRPDLILLDNNMTDLLGNELLTQLLSNSLTANIPVIFLIDKGEKEEGVKALESGAVDYISKPFYIREVIARVKIHLRLKAYEAELNIKNRELEEFSDLLMDLNSKLEDIARKDALTMIWNRRAFDEQVDNIHAYSKRYRHDYGVLLIDLDNFKNYNDNYGHQQGDAILKCVAASINNTCRTTDFVARFGGEEFVVLLPETDEESSQAIAERIRVAVEGLGIKHAYNNNFPVVTVSIGVASYQPNQDESKNWADILKLADKAMYQAKRDGRNKVHTSA